MASRSPSGRVAIVTGAGSGIGRATAALLAAEGAKVAGIDRDREAVASLEGVFGVACDVADERAVRAAVDTVREALGPIDILVNAAGVTAITPLGDDGFTDAWEQVLAVNLTGTMHLVRACRADLLRNGDGRIVNIASTEALGASPAIVPYTVSKHGVLGFTRGLAVELGRTGVTANAVCPGPILTGMTDFIPEDMRDTYARRRVPSGRYGTPEEVAHVIVSLVVPAAAYVNGAAIVVDGGMSVQN